MPAPMSSGFESIFRVLKAILQRHKDGLAIADDAPGRYCLEAPVGPATLRAWGGKVRQPVIPVAWVQVGKSGVSYHLMPIYGNATLRDGMSKQLRARLTGKSCFTFNKANDTAVAEELERLTVNALTAFKAAGFITK